MQKQARKFALIGTSCVGKTTLLPLLEIKLQKKYSDKKIVIVEEAARNYFENRKVRKPFSFFHQNNIQSLAKNLEIEAHSKKPEIIICDRSVIDAIAYEKTKGTLKGTHKLIKNAKEWFITYTHFFLLDPKGIDYQTDQIRKETKDTRESFHISFLSLLQDLKLPHTLITGSKEQRVDEMTKIISGFI